jgi:hypothetical protein
MFNRAMLQRQQQMRVTPLKSWFAMTSTPMRAFASKYTTRQAANFKDLN